MAIQQELPLPEPSGALLINGRCTLRTEGEHRVVVVAELAVHLYSARDAVAEAYAAVFLVNAGYATQREVAAAFACSERTLRRQQQRYRDGGMAALATRSGWRTGRRRVPGKRLRIIVGLNTEGLSNREIARRMGVTEKAIRKQVGPAEQSNQDRPDPVEPPLSSNSPTSEASPPTSPEPAGSAEPEPVALSLDRAPANRLWDRMLASLGLLDDAAPVFANGRNVPGAAVLAAVPLLVASGVFRIAHQVYGEIGPAFYGLRTTLLTLLVMALWRIQRPEALKEHNPQSLGRVLGLDRAPEIKTVRRKLTRLASYHKAEQLGAELARFRVAARWKQENCFKHLREECLLDALADYQVEPDDPTRTVPNPERRALDQDVRSARAEVAKLEQAYGAAAADNPEERRPTMRGFKIAHGEIGKPLRAARQRLAELLTRRRETPQRVEVGDLSDGAVVRLATERKHLTNLIKMVAYQAESDLLALLRPHYARSEDEGRTLLHELFGAAADIEVTDTELRVTVCPLSSPHRTVAAQALCEALTATATVFPGSRLTMRFSVRPRPQIGQAFPGPRPQRTPPQDTPASPPPA